MGVGDTWTERLPESFVSWLFSAQKNPHAKEIFGVANFAPQHYLLLGHKCSCTQGTRKDQRKGQNTLDYLLGLTWATERWVDLHPHWPNLQSSYRGLQWIQSYISSRCSQQYLLSQGCVPEAAPSMRTMGRTYIPRTENRVRSLQLPGFNSHNNQRSCLLSDHLQYPCRKEKWEGGGKRWISPNICSSEERKKVKLLSRVRLFETRLLHPWDSPGKNTGVGCHSLLQGIFPTQGSNPGLPHCGQMFYPLSYQGILHSSEEAPIKLKSQLRDTFSQAQLNTSSICTRKEMQFKSSLLSYTQRWVLSLLLTPIIQKTQPLALHSATLLQHSHAHTAPE